VDKIRAGFEKEKEDMKRKNEKLGNKIYNDPVPSHNYSSNLKDSFK
jgi:hypothetical protein